MTSAWKEPPGQDDRAEGQDSGPDETQLEMFAVTPRAGAEVLLPPGGDFMYGSARHEDGGRGHFLDMGGADSDELRRLEDSIRWLMNESGVRHIPRASTLPPVRGLTPVETHDDSLLLNPETLFPPRLARRQGSSAARSAAKILLAGAVVAPATYFIANWMQFPGTAAPSSSAAVSESPTIAVSATIPGMPEDRIAAVTPPAKSTPPEVVQVGSEMSGPVRPEATVSLAVPPANASPDVVADASATEPKRAPELPPEISAPPPPSDPAPGSVGANAAQSSSPPPPVPIAVAAPARPVLSAQE